LAPGWRRRTSSAATAIVFAPLKATGSRASSAETGMIAILHTWGQTALAAAIFKRPQQSPLLNVRRRKEPDWAAIHLELKRDRHRWRTGARGLRRRVVGAALWERFSAGLPSVLEETI
jgi:hypothetical protein